MLEGLPPHNPTYIMRLTTHEAAAKAATDLLGEVFDPAESAVASFEAEDGVTWMLEAYFSKKPDEDALRELVRPILGDGVDEAVFQALNAKDWVKNSLDGLKPVEAGRFLIHGQHDRGFVKLHLWSLEIEAALAFGTGHHGTTRGCLMAFIALLKQRRPRHILDVGTGTGILAFAAAKALKVPVIAGDIDAVAVEVARANGRLNRIAPYLSFYAAPGTHHALARRKRHFDVVFANILARPLKQLAPALSAAVSRHGALILSGLLYKDVAGVLSTYRAQGFYLVRRFDLEGWSALMLSRGGKDVDTRNTYGHDGGEAY
jgi:ribosomal protein L11 methyltransferase